MATTRTSPPTQRIVSVLELLAARPSEHLTLTAISRSAEISPATCLGILNELTRAGYTVRYEDSSYGLGGALISLGSAARDARPESHLAHQQLVELHRDLSLVCTSSAVVGDEIMVLDVVGERTENVPAVMAGMAFPFVAPVGLMFVAWNSDDDVEAWLRRSPVEIDPSKLAGLGAVVVEARRRGFLVERLTNAESSIHEYLRPISRGPTPSARNALSLALSIFVDRDYAPGELAEAGSGSVSVVAAPCFNAEGEPEVFLAAYLMREAVPADEVERIAARLTVAAAAVTGGLGGHNPWVDAVETA